MFKLESYITPILLSYVDKYIKNFRPEDSQVSLWGGEVSFHNLDLRLEVLEEELQSLQFSIVSGHIHELLIRVPWTKLASEPITVTINTIECILKLKDDTRQANSSESGSSNASDKAKDKRKTPVKKEEIENPPGYIQSVVNKIVGNITINCNNLILKYVEEDIVVSMNIKLLTVESADENWKPAFSELSLTQVLIRKLVTLTDLTVCLDRRNAAGKIDVYQEPMLYRCSLELRFMRKYHNATVKQTSTTRIDIHCNSMEFSMTSQQFPMLMRLLILVQTLQSRELKKQNMAHSNETSIQSEEAADESQQVGWAGWAWSFVPSILPTWDEDWTSEQQVINLGHTTHLGVFVDNALFSFKVSECSSEKTYYAPRKLKYWPILSLRLQGCMLQTLSHSVNWVNTQIGIAKMSLLPSGDCTCGADEVQDNLQPQEYFKSLLSPAICHFSDSLLDAESYENRGQRRLYNLSWDEHMALINEEYLLSKSPAVAIDILYNLEVPDDFPQDKVQEMSCDLEYSNFKERSSIRIFVGPFNLRYSSGLMHRLMVLKQAAEFYDYQPYFEPKPLPSYSELPPPSSEDYDALMEYLQMQKIEVTCIRPSIEFVLWDHMPNNNQNVKKRHQSFSSINEQCTSSKELPKLKLDVENIFVKLEKPMYPNRLVYTTCKLPNPPKKLLENCYVKTSAICQALKISLVIKDKASILLNPACISYSGNTILMNKYWQDKDICFEELSVSVDVLNITATKPKLLLANHILDSLIHQNKEGFTAIFESTLLLDSCTDARMEHLEFILENIYALRSLTVCTQSYHLNLESCKAFIIEPAVIKKDKEATYTYESSELNSYLMKTMSKSVKIRMTETFNMNQSQQVIILSGPEVEMKGSQMVHNSSILLSLTVQLPLKQGVPDHPALVLFNLAELRMSLDPLLCRWLNYQPRKFLQRKDKLSMEPGGIRRRRCSEASGGSLETPRRVGPQPTSVHSSENQQRNPTLPMRTMSPPPENIQEPHETQWFKAALDWHVVWKSLLVIGDINQITVYCPTNSIPALGAESLQSAYLNNIDINPDLEIFVLKLPFCSLRSANQRQKLDPYIINYPIKLPDSIWTDGKKSFPWTISIWDFTSFTVQNHKTHQFIKPVTCNATIAVTTKLTCTTSAESSKHDIKNFKSEHLDRSTDSRQEFRGSDHNIALGKVPSLVEMFNKNSNTSLDLNSGFTSNSADQIYSLGICVYIDTMPIVICMSEPQVALISSITLGLSEMCSSISQNGFIQPSFPRSQNPTTPTELLFKESTRASTTSGTTQSVEEVNSETLPKFTVFIQWTLTRFSVKLYGNDGTAQLKLLLDIEDIVNSFDMQTVYVKYKSKIATASIKHYKKDAHTKRWINGPYLGIVMKVRENGNSSSEDNSFASLIFTKARCGNVHNKWGTSKKHKYRDKTNKSSNAKTRYLSELMLTLQSVDFVLSPKTLSNFLLVLYPLSNSHPNSERSCIPSPDTLQNDAGNFQSLAVLNLPLVYLDVRGLRLIIPSSDQNSRFLHQDVFILQISHINLNPAPDNPICRSPLRPDLYQQAAQADLLNVPGSEIEDRQYQLTASAFNISTCVWSQLKHGLAVENTEFNLRTMNENPALEWNNLDSKKSALSSTVTQIPVVNKFDLCIVAAPAMVHGSTIICGHAVEINCVSDLEVNISVDQVKLAQFLAAECNRMLNPVDNSSRSTIVFPYAQSKSSIYKYGDENLLVNEIQYESNIVATSPLDSGVDVGEFGSENIVLTKINNDTIDELTMFTKKINEKPIRPLYDNENFIPFELIFTGGIIGISFYQNHKTTKFRDSFGSTSANAMIMYEKGYEASAEDYSEDNLQSVTQPLIRLMVEQPNALITKTAFDRRFQISIFDIRLDISAMNSSVEKFTPQPNDYRLILVETKPGENNPVTGVPPALITVKSTSGIGKTIDLDIIIARPIKFHFSVDRYHHLVLIHKKLIFCAQNEDACLEKTASVENSVPSLQFCNAPSVYTKFNEIKIKTGSLGHFQLNTTQLVLNLKTIDNDELNISIAGIKSKLFICNRPEKIQSSIGFESVSLNLVNPDKTLMLLHPWSFDVYTTLYWESWQNTYDDCLIQLNVDSDCFVADVGVEQFKILHKINKEYQEILDDMTNETNYTVVQAGEELSLVDTAFSESSENTKTTTTPSGQPTQDQHYKDDLRAGAFQFVDATLGEEIPLPYQVLFWSGIQGTGSMSWRYPQPRLLTKVHIYPVPFQVNPEDATNLTVYCQLQYYSEVHGSFLPYCQFALSESKMLRLNMPMHIPDACSSSVWRVLMSSTNFESESNIINRHRRVRVENYNRENLNFGLLVSPRALAACMRIDSFFSVSLIPNIKCVVKFSCLQVNVFNHLDISKGFVMPEVLKSYQINSIDVYDQEVITLSLDGTKLYICKWPNESQMVCLDTSIKCNVLDYGYLTTQSFLEPMILNFNFSKANSTSASLMTKPVIIKFGPSIGHTLAVTEHMWKTNLLVNQIIDLDNANIIELIPMTRYIICNDTNFILSFGQSATDESVVLEPRTCNYYAWRSHKKKQLLRICVLQYDQMWSETFSIEKCGKYYIKFDLNAQVVIIVDIEILSGTQKKITFRGQIDVYNMTREVFEMKIYPSSFDKSRLGEIQNNSLPGRSRGLSLVLESNEELFMRLRFQGLETYWSGDIPLKENSKNYQPWLVKVPLQEKGQFLCVWCKVVTQDNNKYCQRILVILWPLYMIRSNLPMSTKVQIDTPALDVHLQTTIEGRGVTKQLYCPGTIDHSHQLTFQVDMGLPASNPYVPLNYSLVDQKQLFDVNNLDIDEMIKLFEDQLVIKSQWPFYEEEDFPKIDWIAMDQPQTNVSVRYQSAGQSSCSLLMELSPWCILLNTCGLHLSLHTSQESEISQLPHFGVLTPPRLENTFTIKAFVDNAWHSSNPLQFSGTSNNTNTTGFYMPKITGLIPQEGEIKTIISCNQKLCNLSINSEMKHDIRIVSVLSSHIIYNATDQPFKLKTFALRLDSSTLNSVANNTQSTTSFHSFSSSNISLLSMNALVTQQNLPMQTEFLLQPAKQNRNMGLPITEWQNLSFNSTGNKKSSFFNSFHKIAPATNNVNAVDYGFFICLSNNFDDKHLIKNVSDEQDSIFYGMSAPLRVDSVSGTTYSARRSLVVPCEGYSIPLLLTTHKHKGCTYLTIQYDLNPQLLIVNESYLKLLCAQATTESVAGEEEPIPVIETPELCVFNAVPNSGCTYYTMPSVNINFPEIQTNTAAENNLILSLANDGELSWCQPIPVTSKTVMCVPLPGFGDIKITITPYCYTTLIIIQTVSEIEISAREIRSRLSCSESDMMIENKSGHKMLPKTQHNYQLPDLTNYTLQPQDDTSSIATMQTQSENRLPVLVKNSSLPRLVSAVIESSKLTMRPYALSTIPEVNSSCSTLLEPYCISSLSANKNFSESSFSVQQSISNIDVDNLRSSSSSTFDPNQNHCRSNTFFSDKISVAVFLKSFTLVLMTDGESSGMDKTELCSICFDELAVTVSPCPEELNIHITMSNLQIDNQLFNRGDFDFPVVMLGQRYEQDTEKSAPGIFSGFVSDENRDNSINESEHISQNARVYELIARSRHESLISIRLDFEVFDNVHVNNIGIKDVTIKTDYISLYIEDSYFTVLLNYFDKLNPQNLIIRHQQQEQPVLKPSTSAESFSDSTFTPKTSMLVNSVYIPKKILLASQMLGRPLRINKLTIDEINLLLSVHSSIRMYIALDRSPLHFGVFEKKNILTTHFKLGHSLAMHYLSGAIFGAGWVVGSLEILGSPSGLARSFGTGLKDFVLRPYEGMLRGPWGFLVGVAQGSTSLLRHVTAGTVNSLSKMAASVARNLDRLTLDTEHFHRTEELRRIRPQGLSQGLLHGLTGLGISILGAVGGIAHHPLSAQTAGGVVAGVGVGLVGAVAKPLSGAAELLALAGQGLLHGAGWNVLPQARNVPVVQQYFCSDNSNLKYLWKILPNLSSQDCDLLFATEGTFVTHSGTYEAVALVLTRQTLIIFDLEEDACQREIPLNELQGSPDIGDPTLICFKIVSKHQSICTDMQINSQNPACHNNLDILPMDPSCRARVAQYIHYTSNLQNIPPLHINNTHNDMPDTLSEISNTSQTPGSSLNNMTIDSDESHGRINKSVVFYVSPQHRNHFIEMFAMAKRQIEGLGFPVF